MSRKALVALALAEWDRRHKGGVMQKELEELVKAAREIARNWHAYEFKRLKRALEAYDKATAEPEKHRHPDESRMDWLETQDCWIGVSGEYDISPKYACGGDIVRQYERFVIRPSAPKQASTLGTRITRTTSQRKIQRR